VRFSFSHAPIDPARLRNALSDPACGGFAAFEGWVRDHNEGLRVKRLEYEAFEALAVKEGERIIAEACERFGVTNALCAHRTGALEIGDLAVWVGVSAPHRDEAFRACRYIIDEVKHRVPIWKKEHYENGDSGWVNCERCAAPSHGHGREHGPPHEHAPATLEPDYSRQTALREVGAAGQARLAASAVAVVGAGGLGVPVLSYLAGAGVGRITIIDGDRLEASNLHRQPMYALADTGKPKVELAAARLRALNPAIRVDARPVRLDASNGAELLRGHDLVIDCTDNFSTKFLLNDFANTLGVPAVLSSVYQYEGQLQVVRADRGGACLRCVWPEATRDGLVGNCAQAGVLGPVPGVFGSLQALEALKVLLDLPGQLADELLVLDLLNLRTSRMRMRRAAECGEGVCRRIPERSEPVESSDVEVSFPSLEAALAAGFEVVDVREARELADLPTPARRSLHVPLERLLDRTASGRPAGVPDEHAAAKLLLVCARGARSLAAAHELRARGLRRVYSLRGGVMGLASPH
jgi:adenylyltransferase/sulfurtransferase